MKKQQPTDFDHHLQRIKLAKEATSMGEQMHLAEKSMGILWIQLFDQLCMTNDTNNLSNIKDLSTILHKLLQNYKQLSEMKQKIQGPSQDEQSWLLSENTLRDIEDQLQLL